eukprot:5592888-Heterocapsa_arctica.AAC.1
MTSIVSDVYAGGGCPSPAVAGRPPPIVKREVLLQLVVVPRSGPCSCSGLAAERRSRWRTCAQSWPFCAMQLLKQLYVL